MGQIDTTFGALYIGTSFALVLFGITILQTYFYYRNYSKDSLKLRLLVWSVCMLDAVHSAFICHVNYYYLVSGFGNSERLKSGVWSLFMGAGITVILSFIIKAFYTYQIYQLCGPRWRWWICTPVILSVLAHGASGLQTITDCFIRETFEAVINAELSTEILSVTNLVSDTVIAAALCGLLGLRKSKVRESQIDRIINGIIVFCVERFILSQIVSVVQLVTEIVLPNGFYDAAIDMVYGKVVANSFLATLNSRKVLRAGGTHDNGSTTDDSTDIPLSTPPATTIISRMFRTTTAESSIDDAGGYGLRTRDLESTIQTDKS
ncbi:hypothetical protein PILCRDRAFT_828574 [Piloderma croceum F 1598]|uniref:DUF6534 domain-containing protein n=1 Tax=Piloderma croceum (strain F 1598) TaxID=765440 RepID=A0A0C3F1M2_PILCF|nr:hypothetical protein PILCRDRAFT_828574 [Piloderma croceum F 1598]